MLLMSFIALNATTPVAFAAAADEEDDFLEETDSRRGRSSGRRGGREEQVREIVRGFYAKADVGGALYLGRFAAPSSIGSSYASSGTYVALGVGQDFVDQEKISMAWELGLEQGLHNGVDAATQGNDGCSQIGAGPAPCTEGDLRTYTLHAVYEFSYYPTRRIGIGGRVGGGVLYSPLLIEPTAYADDVLKDYGVDPGMHNAIKPVVSVGPTVEYYTKLSHFSVGLDADVFYGIGWDLGLNVAGYLKYTF